MEQSSVLAIEVVNVSKIFKVYPNFIKARILEALLPKTCRHTIKVAVDRISLKVHKGEVVGILGPNGAGKTTLLKMIAGISPPSSGTVKCTGKVVAVLALGLGVNNRLTGRENIILAGMLLGLTRKQMENKIEWIRDFSELGDYIDQPISTYSSGMKARLSFSIATCHIPDILIIDEALATGDIHFISKSIRRIHEIAKSGCTCLFVSHSIWSIKKLTERCILIDHGQIVDDGPTSIVADKYNEAMIRKSDIDSSLDYTNQTPIGNGIVTITKAEHCYPQKEQTYFSGMPFALHLHLLAQRQLERIAVTITVVREDGTLSTVLGHFTGGSMELNGNFVNQSFTVPTGKAILKIESPCLLLAPGFYHLDIQLLTAEENPAYNEPSQFYFKTQLAPFSVVKSENPNRSIHFYQPHSVTLQT